MITKQQADEARALLEQYEKEQREQDFLPGELVQVRDSYAKTFIMRQFGRYGSLEGGWDFYDSEEVGFGQCRRPVDVPGVLVRWFGGECPVSDRRNNCIVIRRSASFECEILAAWDIKWRHVGDDYDIIAYMIIPEWMK